MNATELATVLAALRAYQRTARHDPDILDIATDGGRLTALDDAGIDDLCERLNDGPMWHLFHVETAGSSGRVRGFVVSAESGSESKAQELAEAACLEESPAGWAVASCKSLEGDVFLRVRS